MLTEESLMQHMMSDQSLIAAGCQHVQVPQAKAMVQSLIGFYQNLVNQNMKQMASSARPADGVP